MLSKEEINRIEKEAKEYATGMMGLGEYSANWHMADMQLWHALEKAYRQGATKFATSEAEKAMKETELLNARDVAWGQKKEQLEELLILTESQRKEWADTAIKKQGRIEILEAELKRLFDKYGYDSITQILNF